MMNCIMERLYMGDIDAACNTLVLRERKGITHILTIDSKPLTLEAQEGFVYRYVHALDIEDFDLLSQFDSCIQFIDEGREAGGILVHCYAGHSRSGAVVLAYLMKHLDMNLSDALQIARKMRPMIGPNQGFIEQLELFEEMGNHVPTDHPKYRQFRLSWLANNIQKAQNFDQLSENCLSSDPNMGSSLNDAVYKCRKCRRPLFRQSGVLTHESLTTDVFFKNKHHQMKRATPNTSDSTVCGESFFVEPVMWMQKMIYRMVGKLTCPKCSSKIGSFNWSGEQCPCGRWITPAFHMQKAKVDFCVPRQPVVSMSPLVKPTAHQHDAQYPNNDLNPHLDNLNINLSQMTLSSGNELPPLE